MTQSSSSKILILTISILSTALVLYLGWDSLFPPKPQPQQPQLTEQKPDPELAEIDPAVTPLPEPDMPEITPEEEAEDLGMTTEFSDPQELVANLTKQLENIRTEDDLKHLATLLGGGEVKPEHLQQLHKLFLEKRLQLDDAEATKLIGEIKAGKQSRWAIKLADGSEVQLDITRQNNGKWKVDKVKLPASNLDSQGQKMSKEAIQKRDLQEKLKDPMNYTHHFMQVLTSLDFEQARKMVNSEKVSDAKIAGLCILFEDGNYALDSQKPLQAIRLQDTFSAFYANLVSTGKPQNQKAQFSLTVTRASNNDSWRVNEINLDQLLADYALKVAGGDAYYTPLIDNPNGGDTLVIYFEFDSKGLTERTKKQLDIVIALLQLDARKKVTLSGHTDAIGSDAYNTKLSKERALAVEKYLLSKGIAKTQIITKAYGFSKPRRADTKKDGSDDPNARRANRRTEIYLDF